MHKYCHVHVLRAIPRPSWCFRRQSELSALQCQAASCAFVPKNRMSGEPQCLYLGRASSAMSYPMSRHCAVLAQDTAAMTVPFAFGVPSSRPRTAYKGACTVTCMAVGGRCSDSSAVSPRPYASSRREASCLQHKRGRKERVATLGCNPRCSSFHMTKRLHNSLRTSRCIALRALDAFGELDGNFYCSRVVYEKDGQAACRC